jgi:hypothetical protein
LVFAAAREAAVVPDCEALVVVVARSTVKVTVSRELETLAVVGINTALSLCGPGSVDVDVGVHTIDALATDGLPMRVPSTVNCTVPVNVADLVSVTDAVSVTWVAAVAWSTDGRNTVLVVTVLVSCVACDCAASCLAAAALAAAVLAAAVLAATRVAAAVLVVAGLAAAGTGAAGLAGAG